MRHAFSALIVASWLLLPAATAQESARPALSEQSESKGHLNPVVAKLAAGQTVYGLINTGDLSLANARETARAPVDFVYADMEHSPLDFPGLAIFLPVSPTRRRSSPRRARSRTWRCSRAFRPRPINHSGSSSRRSTSD